MSSLLRIGEEQNEQGWRPSRAQIILPQDRQFGAGLKRGCSVAAQPHLRGAEVLLGCVGLVLSSRLAMAEVRSERLVVVVFDFELAWERGVDVPDVGWEVEGLGEWCLGLDCLERTLGMKSDIREPEADGGRRAGLPLPIGEAEREAPVEEERPPCVTRGSWRASGALALW